MIKAKDIQALLQDYIEKHPEEGLFEVGVSVSPKNEIKVYVDAEKGVNIDTCVAVSRHIEAGMDRDKEDFELTVSSAGLDQPLKVPAQYKKNVGRQLKVTIRGGETLKGTVIEAGAESFILQAEPKKGGKKAPAEAVPPQIQIKYEDVKEAKIVIKF